MKPTVTLQFDNLAEMITFFNGKATAQGPKIETVNASPATLTVTTVTAQIDDDNGPVNTTAPALDARGFPHDERIHAASRALNADGSWRKRRGVSDDVVAAVENEFRARTSAQPAAYAAPVQHMPQVAPNADFQPAPVTAPQSPIAAHFPNGQPVYDPSQQYAQPAQQPAPVYQQPQQPVYDPSQQYAQPAQQPAPAPVYQQPAPVEAAPAAPATLAFPDFMKIMQQAMSQPGPNGRPPIDAAYNASLMQRVSQFAGVQINSPLDFNNRPDLIPHAVAIMRQDGVIA